MAGEGKERYRTMIIVLLMRCIRPLLRELIRHIAARKTPHGESTWTVDDYLRHNRKTVYRKLPKTGRDMKYKNILYPLNSRRQGTNLENWDITLYLFIFCDIVKVDDSKLKYYLESVSNIRKHLCSRDVRCVTKFACKEYRKLVKKARVRLYKHLDDRELERLVQRRSRNIEKKKMKHTEIDDVLARWKTLECYDTEDGAEKAGIEKYVIVQALLNQVCRKVMQALVKRRVAKRHRSLQSFLSKNKRRIARRIDTFDKWKQPEDMLFPSHGEPNLKDWDTSLLCWVLLNFCFLSEIKDKHYQPFVADAIGTLRRIRNEIAHKRTVSLSEEEYNSYLESIRRCINDCLYFLNDEVISEEILNEIEVIETYGIDNGGTMRILQMSYYHERKEHALQTKYYKDQVNIKKELSEIVRHYKRVELPEIQLELMIENCSQESEEMLSKMLVQNINNSISDNEPRSTEDAEMTLAVANLINSWRSKGWNTVSSTKGSVLLNAQCESFDNLCELFETYGNTGSAMCVEGIQTTARRLTGDKVNIYCIMYDSVMNKAMENIVCQLLEITEQQIASAGKADNNHRASVNVLMTPGFNGMSSDISNLISEDVRGQLRRIADIIKKQYGLTNCSITTRSYDFCTPSFVTDEKCNAVSGSDDGKMTWNNFYGDKSLPNNDQHSLNMEYEASKCVMERPVKCNEVSESDDDNMKWNNSDGDPFYTNDDQQSLSVESEARGCVAKKPDEKCNAVTESDDDKITWNNSCEDIRSVNDDQLSLHMTSEAFRCFAEKPDYCSPSPVTDETCNEVSESDDDTITRKKYDGIKFYTNVEQSIIEARKCIADSLEHIDSEVHEQEKENIIDRYTTVFEGKCLAGVATDIKHSLDSWRYRDVQIAVIGRTGVGKSSFINAIRGVYNENDPYFAKVGVTEGTSKRQPYPHPNNERFVFWELPGYWGHSFPQDKYLYCKQLEINPYDAFLIMSSKRFTENEARLASEIKKMGKMTLFVRSVLDCDIEINAKVKKNAYKVSYKHHVIEKIRRDCKTNLMQYFEKEFEDIYLINALNLQQKNLDFEKLLNRLVTGLGTLKADVMLYTVEFVTQTLLEERVKLLKKRLRRMALLSSLSGAIPIPGTTLVADAALIANETRLYSKYLGFFNNDLEELAESMHLSVDELGVKYNLKSLALILTTEGVMTSIEVPIDDGLIIPVEGMPAGAVSSFVTTVRFLSTILTILETDAKLVLKLFRMHTKRRISSLNQVRIKE